MGVTDWLSASISALRQSVAEGRCLGLGRWPGGASCLGHRFLVCNSLLRRSLPCGCGRSSLLAVAASSTGQTPSAVRVWATVSRVWCGQGCGGCGRWRRGSRGVRTVAADSLALAVYTGSLMQGATERSILLLGLGFGGLEALHTAKHELLKSAARWRITCIERRREWTGGWAGQYLLTGRAQVIPAVFCLF
jgi:hypothetical protein